MNDTQPRVDDLFDPNFEQNPHIDECPHQWELVTYKVGSEYANETETAPRCSNCHAPECISSNASGRCIDRRHHRTVHIYPDGEFAPIGGIVSMDDES